MGDAHKKGQGKQGGSKQPDSQKFYRRWRTTGGSKGSPWELLQSQQILAHLQAESDPSEVDATGNLCRGGDELFVH